MIIRCATSVDDDGLLALLPPPLPELREELPAPPPRVEDDELARPP